MRLHEIMAENRIRFAQRLNEMSEELASLSKEVDKNRKQVCLYMSQLLVLQCSLHAVDQGASEPIRACTAGGRN